MKGDAKDLGLSDHNVRPFGRSLGWVLGRAWKKSAENGNIANISIHIYTCLVFFGGKVALWLEGWRNGQKWDGIAG